MVLACSTSLGVLTVPTVAPAAAPSPASTASAVGSLMGGLVGRLLFLRFGVVSERIERVADRSVDQVGARDRNEAGGIAMPAGDEVSLGRSPLQVGKAAPREVGGDVRLSIERKLLPLLADGAGVQGHEGALLVEHAGESQA